MTIYTHLNKLETFPVFFCLPEQSLEYKLKSPIPISKLSATDLSDTRKIYPRKDTNYIFSLQLRCIFRATDNWVK